MNKKEFANAFSTARIEQRLTVDQVAVALSTTREEVEAVEAGEAEPWSGETLVKAVNLLYPASWRGRERDFLAEKARGSLEWFPAYWLSPEGMAHAEKLLQLLRYDYMVTSTVLACRAYLDEVKRLRGGEEGK